MTQIRFGRGALLAGLAAVAALLVLTATALAAGLWSAPQQVDTNGAKVAGSYLLSCPESTLCIGAGLLSAGPVVYELPAGGPPYATSGQLSSLQEPGSIVQLESVACPSSTLCIGTADYAAGSSDYEDVVVSTDPAAGAGSWVEQDLTVSPSVVSCPTTTLCVGPNAGPNADGEEQGNANGLVLSENPAAGATTWTVVGIDTQFISVDCPSAGFCLAVDSTGDVWTSTDPTGGASAWVKSTAVQPLKGLANAAANDGATDSDVSCSGPDLCVATGTSTGTVLVSTDPAGAAAWTPVSATPAAVDAVYCAPSAALCLAGDAKGDIATSTTPATAWASTATADTAGIDDLTCTGGACFAAGGTSRQDQPLLTATAPASGGAWSWEAVNAKTYDPLSSVTCIPTGGACLAVDGSHYFQSANPDAGASSWNSLAETKMYKDHDGYTASAFCLSRTLCVALISDQGPKTAGEDSDLWTFNPLGSPHDFHDTFLYHGGKSGDIGPPFDGLACAQGTCIAQFDGYANNLIQSSSPSKTASWKSITHANAHFEAFCLHGNSSCVAIAHAPFVGFAGPGLLVAAHRGGPWTKQAVDPTGQISGLACTTAGACVIVDEEGNMLASRSPLSGPSSWKPVDQDPAGFNGVACQTATRCVAVDGNGAVVVGHP